MSHSPDASSLRRKGLAKIFPVIADALEHPQAATRLETLEILMDVEHVADLLSGWEDIRQGRVVAMQDAFGDL